MRPEARAISFIWTTRVGISGSSGIRLLYSRIWRWSSGAPHLSELGYILPQVRQLGFLVGALLRPLVEVVQEGAEQVGTPVAAMH